MKIHASLMKKTIKIWHNRHISRHIFHSSNNVLLYDSRYHLFPKKLHSHCTRPFTIKTVYPRGAIDIENPKNSHIFKVNGKRLKRYLEFSKHLEKSHDLVNPPQHLHDTSFMKTHRKLCILLY